MSVTLSIFDPAEWLQQAADMGVLVVLHPDGRIIVGAAITDSHEVARRIEAVKAPLYDRPDRKASVRTLLQRRGLAVAPPD